MPRSSDQLRHGGEHSHPGRVGDDLDPAADHARVHGVVAEATAAALPPRLVLRRRDAICLMPGWRSS
ncbi:hypothetical protein [Modestobacter altitudinis]|uniref:hypothetical protein n=1 Tax=Modestobacter altitudinis TaxID=2213158 RepID=UPI00110D10D5|nr:hypothetical protein [Modestobacter altitudinis]